MAIVLNVTTNFIARLEQSAWSTHHGSKEDRREAPAQVLGGLGRLLVEKKEIASELKHYGADRIYRGDSRTTDD